VLVRAKCLADLPVRLIGAAQANERFPQRAEFTEFSVFFGGAGALSQMTVK
jgi:hypothetical protein